VRHALGKTAEVASGGVATGAAVTPTPEYAEWLLTNGIGVMSYAELGKALGIIWIAVLLLKTTIQGIMWIVRKIKGAQE